MKTKRNKLDDYNQKLQEWQKNQYNPGYYTGGKIPPLITHTGNPKLIGWFMVISSYVIIIIMNIFFIEIFDMQNILSEGLLIAIFYSLFTLDLIAGMSFIKKGTSEQAYKKLKKRLINSTLFAVITIILVVIINSIFFVKESSIKINNVNEVTLIQKNVDTDNVILNGSKLILKASSSKTFGLWVEKISQDNDSFKIYYKWNILTPNHGTIIKVEVIN